MGESCTLGKDEGNDLVIDDRFISGRHLRISRKGSHFVLVDQGSTNGTWLGAVRVFEAEVPLNTTVRVGETEVVLEPWSSARRDGPAAWQGIIGSDPALRSLVDLVERVAPSSAAVTILGESGTGGSGRLGDPRPQPPRRSALHPGQLCGDQQGAHRERALRPRKGGLHRRYRHPQGRLRGGGRRHPSSTRASCPRAQAKLRALSRGLRVGSSRPSTWGPGGGGHQPRSPRRRVPVSSATTFTTGSAWCR